MDQVRCAVISLDVMASRSVHRRMERCRLELLARGSANDGSLGILSDRIDGEQPFAGSYRSSVTYLAARLDIEWVFPEQQLETVVGLAEGEHVGIRLGSLIPHELLLPPLYVAPFTGTGQVDCGGPAASNASPCSRGRSCIAGALTLLVELPLKSGEVDFHAPLSRNDLGQVDGKAKGVIESEGLS